MCLLSHISDSCLQMIVKAFPNLTKVNFTSMSRLSNTTLLALSNLGSQLKSLQISLCLLPTDDGMREVARKCTNLTNLAISDCRQITDKSILELASRCTSLVTLDLSKSEVITPAAYVHYEHFLSFNRLTLLPPLQVPTVAPT